jgi:hypothetical protein
MNGGTGPGGPCGPGGASGKSVTGSVKTTGVEALYEVEEGNCSVIFALPTLLGGIKENSTAKLSPVANVLAAPLYFTTNAVPARVTLKSAALSDEELTITEGTSELIWPSPRLN